VKVSVVVPVKDGARRLGEVLDAVLAQEPDEVLVIDSGSMDGSVEIARARGVRVLEIPAASFGHGRTRNLGVESTEGELVAFLTQDATPCEGWLDAYRRVFEDPSVGVAFGPHLPRPETSPMIARELEEFFARLDPSEPFLSNVNACYRRACWVEIRFDDVPYSEDQAFGRAVRASRWRKEYVREAAVLHAHDYGAIGFMRRYFDEYRGLRRTIGHVEPWDLRGVRGKVAGDRDWMRARGITRAGFVRWSARSTIHHAGRKVFSALGSRADRLPARVQRAISLEGTAGAPALERETRRIVKLVAAFAITLCVVLAAVHFLLRGDLVAAVLSGVTLAMALLPEEFPVVLTVFLALGAWRISRRGVLTRRMPAIEMLGAATVLCVDKTGTLTENRMSVIETAPEVVDAAALACELEPFDPMDRAIVAAAAPGAQQKRSQWRLERDYPFTPDFLAVCHAWRAPDGRLHVAVKGAPETVLRLCGRLDLLPEVERAAGRGLRLLGVATAEGEGAPLADPARYPFRWLGFVALADPLRASVPQAVALCRRAGIRVVMITGDFPGTAREIGRQAGLDVRKVVSGADIEAMDDAALARAVGEASIFARVLPQQKLRLVAAYKAAGEVVAMTGDGVNDAPALKSAHIGVAMGRRGTDVAREAAALVLLEDDFGSIVDTVRLGRRIYENIRNAMRYIVSVHVPTAGMAFAPLVLGWPIFLFPVHVVFLEFVIDPACSIVFEAEPSEESAMERPPRDPRSHLFDLRMLLTSLALGVTVLAGVAAAYWWALQGGRADGEARAIGFAAIVCGNLALILSYRSRLRAANPAVGWIAVAALGALAASIYVPAAAEVFRFAPLGLGELVVAAVAGVSGVAAYEAFKLARS